MRQQAGRSAASKLELLEDSNRKPIRVLLATDGSGHALRAASFLGAVIPGGSHVRLITVVSFEFYPNSLWGPPLSDAQERLSKVHALEDEAFGDPKRTLEAAGAEVTSGQRYGRVAEEILEEAAEWAADLVVVGHQGLTGPSRWVLGSVSEYLVRHTKIPVLIVP